MSVLHCPFCGRDGLSSMTEPHHFACFRCCKVVLIVDVKYGHSKGKQPVIVDDELDSLFEQLADIVDAEESETGGFK
jgi:hypothetical protein